MKKLFKLLLTGVFFYALMSCDDKGDYDKAPDWLRGNAWQFMEERGNFTNFLAAAELTGFRPSLEGRALCTVFAPDDEAFSAWLKENNYSSVEDVDLKKLNQIIGYHILGYAYSRTQLLNFQMQQNSNSWTDIGMAHKYQTFSKADPVMMYDPTTQRDVKVYQREKFLPVFSTKMFSTLKVANPEEEYKALFPDVNWKGADDQLYVMNAAMKEVGTPTDNGFIYIIDKVVTPLPTLHAAMEKEESRFSTFRTLFDRFQNIYYDKALSEKYGEAGEKYYVMYHNNIPRTAADMPEIASEWSYHGEEDASRPAFARYLKDSYNCFPFENKAFEEFFNDFFTGFSNYNEISDVALFYLLGAHSDDHQNIKLKGKLIENGVVGTMGENWSLANSDITYHKLCANGTFFGVNKIFRPILFDIITRPLFQSADYNITANMFNITSEFITLADREKDHYTLFIQNDDGLREKYGYRVKYNSPAYGDEQIEQVIDGTPKVLTNLAISNIIQSHIIEGAIRDFGERRFFTTKRLFTYIYVENGMVYGEKGNPIEVINITAPYETENGVTYEIPDVLSEKNEETIAEVLSKDMSYSDFYQLMLKAKLAVVSGANVTMPFLANETAIAFIPKNGTWINSAPTNLKELEGFLRYHFVGVTQNTMGDYILPSGVGFAGKLLSMQEDPLLSNEVKKVYNPISVLHFDNKKVEIINKASNKSLLTDGEIPRFLSNGLIYTIDEAITAE